ncbi:glycoside hydrolase family 3 N-terminal domain-containing protein [Pelagerythrobacter aerophilus]|uniref:1,4-beta-D-glucan glucohydrolase n=1 Tax=Pelagerythrobacter aerophilus TaxID=2306995 RepID=A0A418NFS2_9SPHN|nr:glycoside hydrolase family 3 N-terminal domain-containing protein [Pelagerythrobacter aerophilus]RIV76697.1 1,4-beta-D-glucan glucohydrolase [Pelagerythrobacter aerophilus]
MNWRIEMAALGLLVTACGGAMAQDATSVSTPQAEADPQLWPAASSPDALTDPATETRIEGLLAKMTLEQKVGQLIQADISAIEPADLAAYPVGSILAGGNSGPYGNERASAADWNRLVREFRTASLANAGDGLAIPIIFGVDAVHGHNNIPGATVFPHNIGLGAAHDVDLIRRIGAATAREIAASGIEWTFAPTLAVPQDPRWGRTYEGYSSDPKLVAAYAEAMVQGLQGELKAGVPLAEGKVAATAKHYLADGGTDNGVDQGDATISEEDLVRIHAAGYPVAIEAGALTVMASFSSWNGVKHHGNHSLLTDVLKDRMGFDGFVVGDWNGHGQVAGCTVTSCAAAINAGLDMFMAPDSWKALYTSTLAQARDGTIPMARIDDAVRRILRVKAKLGLLDDPLRERADYSAIGSADHLALAREAVAKSLVLLKNNGSVLPIRPGAKVLVAGPGADNMAMQNGGWTISWQGTDVAKADFPNGQTIWQALSSAIDDAGGTATLSADGSFDSRPDVAVVVLGETPYAEMQGDVPTLDYQPIGAEDLALLRRLKGQGIPVVSIFLSGRPMFTSPEINASDAFVAAWLPGTQANGIADVLVARRSGEPARDFSGTLPFDWPADARSPVTEPLFDRGYGLTYAASQTIPQLSEDLGIDLAEALNLETFFADGRAQDPWVLAVADAGGKRPVGPGAAASPGGAVAVRSVDVTAQEDGKAFTWSGAGQVLIEGPPANLSAQHEAGDVLRIDMRVDDPGSGEAQLAMHGQSVPLTSWLAAAPRGEVATLRVPLRCLFAEGEVLKTVGNVVRIDGDRGLALTLLEARLEEGQEDPDCTRWSGADAQNRGALIFSDDFNAGSLDRDKWSVVGPEFWVNNEQQAYVDSPETIRFLPAGAVPGAEDGVLVLQPRFSEGFETPTGRVADFVSGRINTRGKFDFTHGRAAARIRMPDAEGVWPAFWLLGNGNWPDTGEIDILEYVGEKDWVGVALHGPGYSGETPLVNKHFFEDGTDVTQWHVYAVEWSDSEIVFTVDDRTIYRATRPMVEHYGQWVFDTPKFVILNFALGGAYPFKTNGIEEPYNGLPAETVERIKAGEITMEVDWVRVHAAE